MRRPLRSVFQIDRQVEDGSNMSSIAYLSFWNGSTQKMGKTNCPDHFRSSSTTLSSDILETLGPR